MAMVDMARVEPLEDVTDLLEEPERLREKAEEEGLLFFRGLLDPKTVSDVRSQVLAVCDAHGWLVEGTDPKAAVANQDAMVVESRDPRWQDFYCDIQKVRDFHALALEPAILNAFETLFGEPVLPHSRNICRVVFPNSSVHSTPPHQDNLYIGGSEQTWTAWIPVGDVPVTLGGLAVTKGTHKEGKLEDKEAVGAGGRRVDVEEDVVWVGGDYSCGDVIFLHSLTVHQGRDNLSDRLRLSFDFRYQPRSHRVRSDSLLPHMGWVTWDEVYSEWEEDDLTKYYWRGWELDVFERQ
ncbi:TPA: phytanoyl-CoA dioxygenase [Candidatus Latescibacteria bacterium]|nr:phytanoyl-CoA dioxygenase [Candidatus Latescibacterota bacterium]|tara:strand:- start:427 stop:1308 length:882 start_codon:yes stop_codon:yes gene_type:complete